MSEEPFPQAQITKQYIAQFLPQNPTILEAGAHIGRDTVKMSKLWPEGAIYAFEPVPELFKQLQENTKAYTNIICFPVALSNRVGHATMYVSSGASTAASSLHEPSEYHIKRPEVSFTPVELPTTTIDTWAKEQDIDHIDFMWLDMQGHELIALEGAAKILPTVKVILIEASLTERFKDNPLYQEVHAWMEKHGFQAVQEDIPKHDKINILFVRIIYKGT
jgi:2-O-methyltransferase